MKRFFIVVFLWSLSGCGMMVFQQSLPNSLWGEWAIERMGPAEGSISETGTGTGVRAMMILFIFLQTESLP